MNKVEAKKRFDGLKADIIEQLERTKHGIEGAWDVNDGDNWKVLFDGLNQLADACGIEYEKGKYDYS